MKYSNFLSWKAVSENFFSNRKNFEDGTQFQISQVRIAFLEKGKDEIKIKHSYFDTAEISILNISSGAPKGL